MKIMGEMGSVGGGKSMQKKHPPKIQNAQNLKKIWMKIYFLPKEKITQKHRAGECGEFSNFPGLAFRELRVLSPKTLSIATTAVTFPVLEFSIVISLALIVSSASNIAKW